eukprot:scaffold407_cov168-Amphora_coffeaeformis.AAC.2
MPPYAPAVISNNPLLIHFGQLVGCSVGLYQRHRLKLHAGSDLEILERLSDYGLRSECIPAIFGGTWKQEDFSKWVETRHKIEASRYKGRKYEVVTYY